MRNLTARLPLRVVLTVPFVLLLLVTGALIGYLTFRNSQRAVNDLAGQLHSEVTARIQQQLDSYLAAPQLINQLNLDGIRLDQVNTQDLDRLGQHFVTQIQRFDPVVSIAYATEQGDYVSGQQRIGTADLSIGLSTSSNSYLLGSYAIDDQGRRGERLSSAVPDYDPRPRPWYRAAIEAGRPIWTPVYVWSAGQVGLDAIVPVYSQEGALMGVLDTSLILTSFSDFLQNLRVADHGQTFIIERSGLLVAASTIKEPYTRTGDELIRLAARDSAEPVVRAAAQQLEQQFGALTNITAGRQFYFDLAGERHFAQVTPYQDQYGLDWLIVVVVPESDFMAQIYINNRNTALLILASLLVSIVVATLMARRVTGPMLGLNQAARRLAQGDWTHKGTADGADELPAPILSRIDEVGQLAQSFSSMAGQLRASFETLEVRVRERTNELAERNAQLQQEIAERQRAEAALQHAHAELEQRVTARTAALALANRQLSTEIAERKQAEDARRASEARYRLIVETADEGIWMLDPEGRTTFVNGKLGSMLGYPADELLGSEVVTFLHASGREIIADKMARRRAGITEQYDLAFVRRDGSTLWTLVSASPIMDAQGQYMGALAMLTDITARKQVEEQHRQLLHTLRERLKELTALHRAAHILHQGGVTTPALLHDLAALLPPAFQYPEVTAAQVCLGDHVAMTPGFDDALALLRTDFTADAGIHGCIAVGYTAERPAEAEGPFLAEERQLIESLADMLRTAYDRTQAEVALADREARLRTIFDRAPIGIALVDLQGHLFEANPALIAMLGYTADELRAMPFAKFTHPDDVDADLALFGELIAGAREFYALQKRYIRKDGQVVWGNLSVSFIRDSAGTPQFAIAMVEDITERKRIEQQYLQAQKLDSIGRLAGGIAHDFNNLLTIILGNAGLLLEELGGEHPLHHDAAQIRDAASRAAALTRQLLAFSRKQVLIPRVVDLNAVVEGIAPLLRRLIGEHITLTVRLAPDLGRIVADPGQLEQVIVNLAVNARDAMENGGDLIIETANAVLDGPMAGDYVLLAVSDSGVGMDVATRERIFEPFFTTKEPGKGTGLGLAIVYGVITQSGGHIWVYSEVGQGTTFKAYLPRNDRPEHAIEERAAAIGAEAPANAIILLVEDDAGVRDLVGRLLCGWGHQVLEATDAQDALRVAALAPAPIDLLLTDVIMPGGTNGAQLAAQLRAAHPTLRVLYMSGYTDTLLTTQAVLPVGQGLIMKPFTADALERALREALMPVDIRPPALEAHAAGA